MRSVKWRNFQSPWKTPYNRFQGYGTIQMQIPQNGAKFPLDAKGNQRQAIEWYQFLWPRVIPDLGFKVAVFFEIKYRQNCARQSHSYYWTL